MVSAAVLFNLGEHLAGLGELRLQKLIGLEKLVPFFARQIKVSLYLIERCDLALSLRHFFSALLAELVVVGAQKSHLLEQNVVLLSQQVDAFPCVLLAFSVQLEWQICSQLLQVGHVDAGLFNESEIFALLYFETGNKFFVLSHELLVNLSLLANSSLQCLNVLRERCDVVFVLLYKWTNRVPAHKLSKAIIDCNLSIVSI